MNLYQQWMEAKAAEAEMTARRRAIEEEIAKSLEVPEDWEGSYTMKDGGFKINVNTFSQRILTAINADHFSRTYRNF